MFTMCFSHFFCINNSKVMEYFNRMSGEIEWQTLDEQYDYTQEIARSSFADMVNDKQRNVLYYKAIKKSINKLLAEQKCVRALDIGTGTGLLSMMCAKTGAHSVTACESFSPIAKCAIDIIANNGLSDQIKVVNKRSHELTVGTANCDMSEKANVLVAEVFDTELIGEGAIGTYREAVKHLLTNDALLIPYKARIYGQLAQSDKLFSYHQFNHLNINQNITIFAPKTSLSCDGSNILHDLQVSQLEPNNDFFIVSEPKVIFEFEFKNLLSLNTYDNKTIEFEATRDINGPLVLFVWWDLCMDFESEFVLSCAPVWSNHTDINESFAWRDHWMQSVYYFPAHYKRFTFKQNEKISVKAYRDDYSLWFNVDNQINQLICKCGLHSHISRTRLALINDSSNSKLYYEAMHSALLSVNNTINALYIGDQSLLPIMVSKLEKVDKVYCFVRNTQTEKFVSTYSKSNDCDDKICFITKIDDIKHISINFVFSEPYFNSNDLPWDGLQFWYTFSRLSSIITLNNPIIMPYKAIIKAIPVEFDDLWKIRAKVGNDVEGFDLRLFDQLIQQSINSCDCSTESQPLWEYPGKALAEHPIQVFVNDFSECFLEQKQCEINIQFDISDSVKNLKTHYISLVFWVEFYLYKDFMINTGPIDPIKNGEYISWNRYYKQAVYFLPNINEYYNTFDNILKFLIVFDKYKGELSCNLI